MTVLPGRRSRPSYQSAQRKIEEGLILKTYVYTIELKNDPEIIRKYRAYHQAVWPEVVEGTRKNGTRRSRIYLLGTMLVLIVDADDSYDPHAKKPAGPVSPREQEWEDIMKGFQKPVAQAKEGEWWAEMELVLDQKTP
jgi:L-rhamnose mutarotase